MKSPSGASGDPSPARPSLWAVVLAGGAGQRFWPLSTRGRPKQLLPLATSRPLIVDTLARLDGLVPHERTLALCSYELVGPIREATGLPASSFLTESRPRGTGPVLTRAAWEIARRDPGAAMVSLHADHFVESAGQLRGTISAAVEVAVRERLLMTIAVPPDRPETGYGYLRPGVRLEAPGGRTACRVAAFVEKPGADTAAKYLRQGFLWNSGIFVWSAGHFLDEVRAWAPEIAAASARLEAGDPDAFFRDAPTISVDEAVLERSDRVGCIEADFRWDDLGSWEAYARNHRPDEAGNIRQGEVHVVEASGNVAAATSGRIVLLGVENLVVVQTDTATLVMPRELSHDLKRLLGELPPELL
ncbi:MAG: sugar phosphate nucleotidyltransferase [Gemmatimonadetes bacterium]|nr:sugar phosphate nucleotidyltransferase [Gemmatimonadota bacterium]MCY3942804.1 sugar phosphate nucleotidyltransferase [Gemmatimonadota bacterium]